MPEPSEPKKETVRIAVPPAASPDPAQKGDTVRIDLAGQSPPPPPAPPVFRPPSNLPPPPAPVAHPNKETARVGAMPELQPVKLNMKKTQPLFIAPGADARQAMSGAEGTSTVPRVLLWTLFVVALLTFLIQLWNYFTL